MTRFYALAARDSDRSFKVTFPDMPGVAAFAETFADATRVAAGALEEHIVELLAAGSLVPEPSTYETIVSDPANLNGAPIAIELHDAA